MRAFRPRSARRNPFTSITAVAVHPAARAARLTVSPSDAAPPLSPTTSSSTGSASRATVANVARPSRTCRGLAKHTTRASARARPAATAAASAKPGAAGNVGATSSQGATDCHAAIKAKRVLFGGDHGDRSRRRRFADRGDHDVAREAARLREARRCDRRGALQSIDLGHVPVGALAAAKPRRQLGDGERDICRERPFLCCLVSDGDGSAPRWRTERDGGQPSEGISAGSTPIITARSARARTGWSPLLAR